MRAGAVLLAAVLPLAAAQQQPPAAPSAPSEAERLVFMHEHLANIAGPRALRYQYSEDAKGKERASDRATLTLSAGAAGRCCDVHGDYLSGERTVNLPDI